MSINIIPIALTLLWPVVEWLIDASADLTSGVLVFFGIIMGYPAFAETIEKHRILKHLVPAICLILGAAGFLGSAHERKQAETQRKQAEAQMTQLIADNSKLVADSHKLVDNTSALTSSMNTMLTSLNTLAPEVARLDARFDALRMEVSVAKLKHDDPSVIADLEAKLSVAKSEADAVSKQRLLSWATGIDAQLEYWGNRWNDEDMYVERKFGLGNQDSPDEKTQKEFLNKKFSEESLPLMRNANDLRRILLGGPEQTPEDWKAASIFNKSLSVQAINYADMLYVSEYMCKLYSKFISQLHSPNLKK